MVLRARYFPAVVVFGCILLLVVPFYYMDHWTFFSAVPRGPTNPSTVAPSRSFKQSFAAPQRLRDVASVDVSNPRSEINEISQQDDADEDQDESRDKIKRFHVVANRSQYQQLNGGALVMGNPRLPFSIQHLNPRAAEFALQMARDRLRIERYGMIVQNEADNITNDVDTWLKESTTENNTVKLQVLVMSYFRGGTTFFGDLLNQHPGTFYHFEPLHSVSGNDQVRSEEDIFRSIILLRHLLRCEYEDTHDYIEYMRQDLSHRFLFEHNRRLWLSCQFQLPLCFDHKFLRSICELHPIHLMKLTRMRLGHARRLLEEFPRLKLIYLVRDPRGLYSSRRDLEWCSSTRSCIDPDVYCLDMQKDLSTAIALKAKYPQRFLAMRYEDLALDTENQMKKVFQFLDLNYNRTYKQLGRFIESHTKNRYKGPLDDGGPYSIRRDSRKTAFSWRKKLSPHEVSYVESACKDVIKQLALP